MTDIVFCLNNSIGLPNMLYCCSEGFFTMTDGRVASRAGWEFGGAILFSNML